MEQEIERDSSGLREVYRNRVWERYEKKERGIRQTIKNHRKKLTNLFVIYANSNNCDNDHVVR